ncbi:MAG: ABC transporter ATP-binding protein [Cellvibrionaceae bacterium]|nr:ABC transporter ATP-binding protein [Cellvibrionaceae bacterium]
MPGRRSAQKDFWALKDISFTLDKGETIGIIGRNGSGKSTLLQIICGVLNPTDGSVALQGRVAALLELGAGFNPDFSGRENIYLNAAIYGLSKKQVDARLGDIIAFADIGEFIDHPVRHYSSGMFVRLAFAVIAHVDADVLIIDEALAVGDALFAQKCMRFLEAFKSHGSILFVSHDSGSITRFCDRAIWLDKGQMQMLGPAKEVTESYHEHLYANLGQEVVQTAGEEQQVVGSTPPGIDATEAKLEPWHDSREGLLLSSPLRNDLKVFEFNTDGNSFGTGLIDIRHVCLRDQQGRKLAYAQGGQLTVVEVEFSAKQSLEQIIVGFLLKNRQGQVLFGENNYLSDIDAPITIAAGQNYRAQFGVQLPYLYADEYVLSVGVASGTQEEHVQHCWHHDALLINVASSHVIHGLIGVHLNFCHIARVDN